MPQDRSLPYVIGLVVLLAVAVILFVAFPSLFVTQTYPPGTTPGASQTPRSGGYENLSEAQTGLLARAKLEFPAVATARVVGTTTLPADLKWIITPDATNIVVQAITYKDRRSGFMVTLRAPLPLLGVYAKYFGVLEKLSGWERDTAARVDLFGLLEYHNTRWQARVTVADVSSRYAQVVLQTLRK